MAFEIRQGPRGPTPYWDGKLLASAYDPDREAHNWADNLPYEPGALVFVAGDPVGRASKALADRGVLAVSLLPGSASKPFVPGGIESWTPDQSPLEDFFRDCFDLWGPEAVGWEVWPPFERVAPQVSQDWGHRFRDCFRTVQGSWLTQRRFGKRLWQNAIRNLLDWERPGQILQGNRPLVIAASGPSLDDGLEILGQHRAHFDLWALPSSFETLVRRGLVPDAGVATDGGFYAREHLHRLAGTAVPLLAALGSAPDPVLTSRPCLFFSQGMAIERSLLGALAPRFTEVPSQGTVAVTALRMALEATTGPVFIAGLDLSFRDLRGHTSPHTVDRRFDAQTHRFSPAEGMWADRLFAQATMVQGGVRTSPALVTYAGWFRNRAKFSRTVYRIAPSGLHWDSMTEVSWDQAAGLWNRGEGKTPVRWQGGPGPDRAARTLAVERALKDLATQVRDAPPEAPWLREAAATAVPEALLEDYRSRRAGLGGTQAQDALITFVEGLRNRL